jgi:secreted effector protein SseC
MTTLSLAVHPGNSDSALPLEPQLTVVNQPTTSGQPAQLTLEADHSLPSVLAMPTVQAPRTQPLLEGRILERLLLNPQSIPDGEQRLLRQQLQQRLSSDEMLSTSPLRYQLVAILLAGADGLPLINPQLQQQLEGKQAAAITNQNLEQPMAAQRPAESVAEPNRRQGDPFATHSGGDNFLQGQPSVEANPLFLAIERALTGDSHGFQQLTQQLVTASQQQGLPERHHLLLLATLLLDEIDPPFTTLDPRARRRLGQQLLSALKSRHSAQQSATWRAANPWQSSERLAAARQAISQVTVGERWSDEDKQQSLPPEVLWSGLGSVPATVKLTQVEAVLDSLVDKSALRLANQGPLHTFIGQASMDQLLMVVTTLMIKINNISATFMVQSQKVNAEASNKIMENQLQKQMEEAQKAQEAQENAKKAGIFGMIFNWITAVVATVAAVVTLNPVAIVGAVLLLASAAMETAELAMGSDAPPWLSKVALGLAIAGGILSAGAALLSSAGEVFLNLGKTLAKEGVKAAFKQIYQGIFKAIANALKKLVVWFKTLPEQSAEILDQIKKFGKSAVNKIKQPKATLKEAGQGIAKKTKELTAAGNRLKTVGNIAKGAEIGIKAAKGGIGSYYTYQGEMMQAEIRKLQNESWLLDTLLEYYQKQRKLLQQGMSDLYRQEGDASAIASDLLKESAGLQNRIAGSLA